MEQEQRPVVLVTGAGGRIGSALRAALEDAYSVVGLERSCHGAADCIEVDLTSDEAVERGLARLREDHGDRIAACIHLAAYFDFSGKPDPKYRSVNVDGTRRLLRALRGFEVERFVYASSMLVHAPTRPGEPLTEDAPLAPKWAYPESKVEAEQVVREVRGAIPALILRIAGVYTEQGDLPALTTQVQRIYERQWLSHLFPGDPAHGQAAVHLDDLARALRHAVDRRGELPQETTLFIGERAVDSYEALQRRLGELIHGEPWSTHSIPKPVAAGGAWARDKWEVVVPDALDRGIKPFIRPFMAELADDHYELDTSRAERLLGWRPQHRLWDTLPAIVAGLKADPAGWYRHNRIPLPGWLEEAEATPQHAAKAVSSFRARSRKAHRKTLWAHWANAGLGLWLMSAPFTFGLAQQWMEPSDPANPTGRGPELTHTWMTASDLLTGALLVLFSLLAFSRDRAWARWVVAALGTWLLFAPLVFWTPSAAAYANDTLVGGLVIALAVGVAPPPGVGLAGSLAQGNVPPGWDYNPSAWTQRIPIIFLAFIGLFISRYLAAFQLGHVDGAWDPFFGDGTEHIITSSVSEAWPVPDAGLGAATYVLEVVTGAIGDRRRWRTMPWLVLLFGFMIVPLGGTSLFFIIIQPVWLGTWCTLCLVAAAAMLLQIPYSFDEILATLQFLRDRRRKGKPWLRVLLLGDRSESEATDPSDDFEQPGRRILAEMVGGGIDATWALVASVAIGVLLMLSRILFGTEGTGADSDHVVGALVITFAVTAMAEMARSIRLINVLFGAWLLLAPWMLDGFTSAGLIADLTAGVALIGLSLYRGPVCGRYGDWNRWIV